MINKELVLDMVVAFGLDGKVYKGNLLNWNVEDKTYEISITHVDNKLLPPVKSLTGTKVAIWDGPILGIV